MFYIPFLTIKIDSLVQMLQEWLGAPSFMEDLGKSLDLRKEGTSEWLFEEKSFRSFVDKDTASQHVDSPHKCLWVNGNDLQTLW